MSKSRRELSAEERKLWRRVAATVKARGSPPPPEDEASEPPLRTAPPPIAGRASEPPAAAPRRHQIAPPQNRAGEKRVRRGKLEIDAALDLHGHTQDSARAALGRFLQAAQRRGDRVVVVVTGVGRGGEGVLKRRLPDWLAEREIRALVSGYSPAHRAHGGAGAFYVFVKRAAATPS